MHTADPKFVFLLFLLLVPIVCSSEIKVLEQQEQTSYRQPKIKTTQHDFINPPSTTLATTLPTDTSTPGVVTVTPTPTPGSTPTSTPGSTPVTVSPTNPGTTPSPTTNNPGGQPASNPATTTPTPTGGAPPAANNAQGQKWCVAKSGAAEKSIQAALDYACGIGKTDCSAIQQGASCYNPNTLQNHASYAFNSYYQKNPVQTSCDFGGVAVLTNANPSSGSCVFPTSSSSTTSPTTPSPTTPTPTPTPTTPSPTMMTPTPTTQSPVIPSPNTTSSTGATPTGLSGTPPNILNASNPTLGGAVTGIGDSPPNVSTSPDSMSSNVKPYVGCIIAVMSIIIGGIVVLDI